MVFFFKKVNSIMRHILCMSYVKEFFRYGWLYSVKPKKTWKIQKKGKDPNRQNPNRQNDFE